MSSTKLVAFRASPALVKWIDREAERRGRNRSNFINYLLNRAMDDDTEEQGASFHSTVTETPVTY